MTKYDKLLESLAKRATPADRASYRRQNQLLTELVEKLKPIEESILELYLEKQPIMDEIASMRMKMVDKCIHPSDQLTIIDDSPETHIIVRCKFCEKQITIRKDDDS